jgi:hypothetical protein
MSQHTAYVHDTALFYMCPEEMICICIPYAPRYGQAMDAIHRDHKLTGNFVGRRDCHIESDWLMIYRIDGDRLVFERMGTHSDLFKK